MPKCCTPRPRCGLLVNNRLREVLERMRKEVKRGNCFHGHFNQDREGCVRGKSPLGCIFASSPTLSETIRCLGAFVASHYKVGLLAGSQIDTARLRLEPLKEVLVAQERQIRIRQRNQIRTPKQFKYMTS